MPEQAITVRDLRKSYGPVDAVRGISFDVERGEVFGLLGPNGAGKTTTVEILEGYRARTSGIVSVLGHDPQQRARDLRRRVGIVLQSSGIYRHIKVREAVEHWEFRSARTVLDSLKPKEGEEDLRSFEWHHLRRRLPREVILAELDFLAPVPVAAISAARFTRGVHCNSTRSPAPITASTRVCC